MSRSYRGVRPKSNRVYAVPEVMTLYGISRNTLSNWVAGGLRPVDCMQPQLFRGSELFRFHAERTRAKRTLRRGEFKCVRCKAFVFPEPSSVQLLVIKNGAFRAEASCPDCGALTMKLLGETECNSIKSCIESSTSLASVHEDEGLSPAGIGKNSGLSEDAPASPNERLIYDWQAYAGRFDVKTADAHLASIRDFERFVEWKPFSMVTKQDAAKWRDFIIASEGAGLKRSTIRHRASHLKQFFDWLGKQVGYRKSDAIGEYFELPKRFMQGKVKGPKVFATLDQAIEMLAGMPSITLKERRDRAIFALANICGFRASALISLRLRHVDIEGRRIIHDGEAIRGKNGKSFVANWCPKTDPFQKVFTSWFTEVGALGLTADDALFPDMAAFARPQTVDRTAIVPMKTACAVSEVFRKASEIGGLKITPHSVRDTLAQLGDQVCRTSEERKAWSLNLGHGSEAVTLTYYGKISDERRGDIFEAFEDDVRSTADETELMLAYHEHRLAPGTPEFERAEEMVYARKQRFRKASS